MIFYRITNVCYSIFLGVTLGASFALGAFVAPSVFNTGAILGGDLLSKHQEGLIMTEIFKRYCSLLNLTVGFVVIWEAVGIWFLRKKDYVQLFSAGIVIITGLLFTSYFTPEIIQAQNGGPSFTTTKSFQSLHQASVTNFSFLMIALAVMMAKISFCKSPESFD